MQSSRVSAVAERRRAAYAKRHGSDRAERTDHQPEGATVTDHADVGIPLEVDSRAATLDLPSEVEAVGAVMRSEGGAGVGVSAPGFVRVPPGAEPSGVSLSVGPRGYNKSEGVDDGSVDDGWSSSVGSPSPGLADSHQLCDERHVPALGLGLDSQR